jgi:oligosaccharide reducing-end xylanase
MGGAGGLGGTISTGRTTADGGGLVVGSGGAAADAAVPTGDAKVTSPDGKKASGGSGGSAGKTGTGGTGLGGSTYDGGTSIDPIPGCTPPATYPNLFVTLSGHTQEESDTKVAAAWSKLFNPKGSGNIYFDGPGSDESYVKDNYNGDVRTEGMGYGMIAAVQLDHQTEFDRLWTWVVKHMANGTGEISWSCSTGGGKNSSGGAPDGEEYMATALIFAHKRWGDAGKYNYAKEAQWVLNVIRTKYFNSQYHLVKFVSGANNTDASYILPAFYQVWACFDTANTEFWNESVKAAREFFPKAIDGNGVIGDQSSFTGGTTKGAGSDTIRCVANIMMDYNFFKADPWQADTYAAKYGKYMKTQNVYTAQMSCNALLGFGLPASDGKAFVDKLWTAAIPSGSYWDGTLYMLGMLHVSGTFKLWY